MSVPDKIQTWQMVKGPIYDAEARKVTASGELKKLKYLFRNWPQAKFWFKSQVVECVIQTCHISTMACLR